MGERRITGILNSSFVTRHSDDGPVGGYQEERTNVEVTDLTVLVIRALGLIIGQHVKDGGGVRGVKVVGGVSTTRCFVLTALVTSAAQRLNETLKLDFDPNSVTSRRIGRIIKKMPMPQGKQARSGKRGWMVSLEDVSRWAVSYGLDLETITGLSFQPLYNNAINDFNAPNATPTGNVSQTKPNQSSI
jgi:hypothetical protein